MGPKAASKKVVHPLQNLTQVIHVDEDKFLLYSTVDEDQGGWEVRLFTLDSKGRTLTVWKSSIDLDEVTVDAKEIAQSIKGGYLYLHSPGSKKLEQEKSLKLEFHSTTGGEAVTQELKLVSEPGKEVHALLLAAFGLLEPQTGSTQTSEIKTLRSELTAKEIEISSLNAKLASAKASVTRSSGSNTKKILASPQKKAPANASGLQPNQKRRKAVQDEFAGSSDEMDEDEDDD